MEEEARKLRVSPSGMATILAFERNRRSAPAPDAAGAGAPASNGTMDATNNGSPPRRDPRSKGDEVRDRALTSAGLAGKGSEPTPDGTGGSPDPAGPALSPEDLLAMLGAFRAEILGGYAGALGLNGTPVVVGQSREDRVRAAIEPGNAQSATLALLAPAALKGMPEVAGYVDRFAPYGFLLVFAGGLWRSARELKAIADEVKAERGIPSSIQGSPPAGPILVPGRSAPSRPFHSSVIPGSL